MADEPEDKKPDDKEPEGEKTPKRPPKSTKAPSDDDTNLPQVTVETFAEITPLGWVLFIGTIIAGVALYSWYRQRKKAGKGMLPDSMQERFRPTVAQ